MLILRLENDLYLVEKLNKLFKYTKYYLPCFDNFPYCNKKMFFYIFFRISTVIYVSSTDLTTVQWAIPEKIKQERGGIWNFQGYWRNNKKNFQGLIKNDMDILWGGQENSLCSITGILLHVIDLSEILNVGTIEQRLWLLYYYYNLYYFKLRLTWHHWGS